MDITSSEWLQIIGILIFISGIGIIIYSKKSTIKTVYQSEEKDITTSWMGPIGWIPSYNFDVKLKIKFISYNKNKKINYNIVGTPLKGALGSAQRRSYTINKINHNKKYSTFTLDGNYTYSIEIELNNASTKENKTVPDDKEYDLNLDHVMISSHEISPS
jgi:hypothetical protein